MKDYFRLLTLGVLVLGTSLSVPQVAEAISFTITFDNLSNLPPTNDSTAFIYANGGNTYNGVTFGDPNQFNVTGKDYRVDPNTPGPLYGVPHSGDYFVNNREQASSFITSSYVLTKAWFGSVELYGFGGGATSVTVNAMAGNAVLGSVTTTLPNVIGQPDPMVSMDTSIFLSFSGITGYRIDRSPDSQNNDWVGDDFTFTDAIPVPFEFSPALGLGVLGGLIATKKLYGKFSKK